MYTWPSVGKGMLCYPCMAQKICCALSAEQGAEWGVLEASRDMEDTPKVDGSKGKRRMVGSEEPEGLRPKRAKVEVSLRPGVDAWMAEMGPLMRTAMATMIRMAEAMERRNQSRKRS